MANLTGTGAPNRATQASIGDIYIDVSTNKRYKCVFAYREGDSEKFDTQWTEEKTIKKDTYEAPKQETKVEEPVKPIETASKEEPVEPKQEPKRKNYTQYSKQTK